MNLNSNVSEDIGWTIDVSVDMSVWMFTHDLKKERSTRVVSLCTILYLIANSGMHYSILNRAAHCFSTHLRKLPKAGFCTVEIFFTRKDVNPFLLIQKYLALWKGCSSFKQKPKHLFCTWPSNILISWSITRFLWQNIQRFTFLLDLYRVSSTLQTIFLLFPANPTSKYSPYGVKVISLPFFIVIIAKKTT